MISGQKFYLLRNQRAEKQNTLYGNAYVFRLEYKVALLIAVTLLLTYLN